MFDFAIPFCKLSQGWPPLNTPVLCIDATGSNRDPTIVRAIWRGAIDGGQPVMLLTQDEEQQTAGKLVAWTLPWIIEDCIEE